MQTPQVMAYLATIFGAHRNFEGLGWVVYDTAYRRQTAARKGHSLTHHCTTLCLQEGQEQLSDAHIALARSTYQNNAH